jgi:putative ABC transport system permease protein
MDELFGIPTDRLTIAFLCVFAAVTLVLAVLAVRDRTAFRMATRNLSRRRTQTILIVTGLALATVLFSAAFTTGDTLTNSLRTQAIENIGRVDVVVKAEQPASEGGAAFGPGAAEDQVAPEPRESYFGVDLADEIEDQLANDENVASIAPLARETVPVTSPETDLSEPRVDVLGMNGSSMKSFDRLETASGGTLAVGDLANDEVYLSREAAEGLGISQGDEVEASLFGDLTRPEGRRPSGPEGGRIQEAAGAPRGALPGTRPGVSGTPAADAGAPAGSYSDEERPGPSVAGTRPTDQAPQPPSLKVAGVYEGGANPASDTSMVMGIGQLQELVDKEGRVNEVLVAHGGPAVEGGEHTDSTVDAIRPLLKNNGLEADPVKKDAIDRADSQGEALSTLFVLFGQFSVAAGMLLIFLIFVMLAAERKHELGIARAVGMRRSNLILTFALEGALYALPASAVGSILGVGVGWVMVRLLGRGFAGGGEGFGVVFAASPQNVVLAFCMGMVLTFTVVVISSWRVSRLNVVRAIRDIPEPDRRGRTVWGVVVAVSLPVAGCVSFWQGLATGTMAFYLGGISLVLIGAALLARVLGLSDRIAFTASALVLLALWLTPASVTAPAGMAKGPEMFFVSGIAIVVAGVWLVVFNADAILWVVVALFGRVSGLTPVLKTAVKYPTQSLFRTGMALAMFMLVVFTLTAMNFIQAAMSEAFGNAEKLSGGYEVRADAGYADPVTNLEGALKTEESIDRGEVRSVGQVSNLAAEVKQAGTEWEPGSLYVQGVDRDYSGNVGYGFRTTAEGYGSARDVWEALQTEEGTAVVSSNLAPTRNESTFGPDAEPPVRVTGFYAEDAHLPGDLYLRAEDPESGRTRQLRVIGVLPSSATFAGEIMTGKETLEGLAGRPLAPQTYYFDLGGDARAAETARTLENEFAENGLQTSVTAETIREADATRRIVFVLLRGFMGLGLVVGICALGVISARSVVERRQQIGMMRALGFQRGQVRLTFLIESSFIALLGIGVGVALGLGFSGTLIENIRQNIPGLEYRVPWGALLLVVVLGYAASLITTFLPARRASRIYPAEALRYE